MHPRNTSHKTASAVGWGGGGGGGGGGAAGRGQGADGGTGGGRRGGGGVEKVGKNRRKIIIYTNNIFCDPSGHQPLHCRKTRGRLSRCSTTTPPTQSQEAQNPENEWFCGTWN